MSQQIALESNAVFMGIEYFTILVSGFVGGLVGVRKKYDGFAIIVLAWATALGGGLVRDILLGDIPPVGVRDRAMVLIAIAAGVIIMFIHPEIERMRWTLILLDAVAMALFSVIGTEKALAWGTGGMTAVFLGMATAFAGGVLRDVLVGEVPVVIRDKHLYAVPSAVACILTIISHRIILARGGTINTEIFWDVVIVIFIVFIRFASVKWNLTVPGASKRSEAYMFRAPRRHKVSPDYQADVMDSGEIIERDEAVQDEPAVTKSGNARQR